MQLSSLRLDVVIKEMNTYFFTYDCETTNRKMVKVNHTIVDSADFQLQANDLISIQGFGRAHITDLGGKTKKDKTHITYRTLFK